MQKNVTAKIIFIVLFFLVTLQGIYAQETQVAVVKGVITDRETREPLQAASVYFEGTTIGAIAAAKGAYVLEVRNPGNYELVVSMVGYEPQKVKLSIEKGKQYVQNVSLIMKPMVLNQVEIKGEDRDEWRSDLKIFTRKLLGLLDPSKDCVLEDKEIINFKWDNGTLLASAGKPFTVVNNYTGYRVSCDLVNWQYNKDSDYLEFALYTKFTELASDDNAQKEKWKKNREELYFGSPTHFLWALRHNKLAEEKFKLYLVYVLYEKSANTLQEIEDVHDLYYPDQFLDTPIFVIKGYANVVYNRKNSFIKTRFPFFTIDSYGIADNHIPFLCYSYWAKMGVANMLPRDYMPERLLNSMKK